MDIPGQQRVLKLFEEALGWPRPIREARLGDLLAHEPAVLAQVLAMLRADDASALLPTKPPEPSTLEDDSAAPERIGNYRIVDEIGRGGMGLVYRAERDDGLFEQKVAIKVIRRTVVSGSMLDQFANERRILARLHHPHIAQLLDGGVDEHGSPYIIMELIEGVPVTEFANGNQLDLAARLALFRQACEAADYAHRELVVHADIKPSNVVVAPGFGVKLLDFGIARLIGEDGGRAASAHTPGYSSPARRSGERSTPADDVFALGVLLDQLIGGVAGTDDDLRAVAAKAACEVATRRYVGVDALLADLDAWQRHEPVGAHPPDRRRKLLLFWRRNTALVVGVSTVFVFAVAMTGLFLQTRAARNAAEARFAETRSLSNYLVSNIVTDLESMPGTGPMRGQIAEQARKALEKLSKVPGAPLDLQVETAQAYGRVGEVLASEDLRETMDPATGEKVLAEAEQALRTLMTSMPGKTELRLSLARTLFYRATVVSRAKSDPDEARKFLAETEQLLR